MQCDERHHYQRAKETCQIGLKWCDEPDIATVVVALAVGWTAIVVSCHGANVVSWKRVRIANNAGTVSLDSTYLTLAKISSTSFLVTTVSTTRLLITTISTTLRLRELTVLDVVGCDWNG